MQAETSAPAAEQVNEQLTEAAIRNKVTHIVCDLINSGLYGMAYTPRQIKPNHTFDQLNMTEHEKNRLFMQCEEYYQIDFEATAYGFKQIEDLIKKIIMLLKDQGRLAVPAQDTEATSQA